MVHACNLIRRERKHTCVHVADSEVVAEHLDCLPAHGQAVTSNPLQLAGRVLPWPLNHKQTTFTGDMRLE